MNKIKMSAASILLTIALSATTLAGEGIMTTGATPPPPPPTNPAMPSSYTLDDALIDVVYFVVSLVG